MEQPESNPTFCTNNCGFYGSSQFEGMCSKCYRDHVSRSYNAGRTNAFPSYYSSSSSNTSVTSQNFLQDEDTIPSSIEIVNSNDQLKPDNNHTTSQLFHVASAPVISNNIDIQTTNDDLNTTETCSLGASPISSEKKKRNRCTWDNCNKKLGLTGFDCRCGGQFCSLHRYANEHNCTFDYKEHGQNEIRKNMPVVQGERVRKI